MKEKPLPKVKADDIFAIMYTPGTLGTIKASMVTH